MPDCQICGMEMPGARRDKKWHESCRRNATRTGGAEALRQLDAVPRFWKAYADVRRRQRVGRGIVKTRRQRKAAQ